MVVAIIDFDFNDEDLSLPLHFVEKVGSDLSSNKLMNVIVHSEIASVMMDVGLKTGKCEEVECLVNSGRLMELSHIVRGNLTKDGNLITVSAEIIEIKSGIVTKIEPTYCLECNSSQLILSTSGTVSAKIAALLQPPAKKSLTTVKKPEEVNSEKASMAKTSQKPTEYNFFRNTWTYVGIAALAVGSATLFVIMYEPEPKVVENSSGTIIIN